MPSKLLTRSNKAVKSSIPSADKKESKLALIIAGEASADLHGSNLVKAIKRLDPSFSFLGIGGDKMKQAGVEILFNSSEMAVVGATEALGKIRTIYRAAKEIKSRLKTDCPDLLILIDYPEFNIHIAHTAKKAKVPVLYFISPQIWAWRKGRVKKIVRRIDRMAVILPFEKAFYEERGVRVDYVGHPILDSMPVQSNREEFMKNKDLASTFPVIGLIPGSREEEVKRMLPPMIEAAEILSGRSSKIRCILSIAPTISPNLIRSILYNYHIKIDLCHSNIYDVLSVCHAAMVTSGTATLETALMGIPMVVAYKLSKLSYWVGRLVVDVPYISLANLIAGEQVVTELLQHDVTPERIAEEMSKLIYDNKTRDEMISKMRNIKSRLGEGGASRKTAEIAVEMVKSKADQEAKIIL
ncbi:lipid-A-disaccharide synthase [Thermodesulfobacteriota bacterium]